MDVLINRKEIAKLAGIGFTKASFIAKERINGFPKPKAGTGINEKLLYDKKEVKAWLKKNDVTKIILARKRTYVPPKKQKIVTSPDFFSNALFFFTKKTGDIKLNPQDMRNTTIVRVQEHNFSEQIREGLDVITSMRRSDSHSVPHETYHGWNW